LAKIGLKQLKFSLLFWGFLAHEALQYPFLFMILSAFKVLFPSNPMEIGGEKDGKI
jgi:hypothetical protein